MDANNPISSPALQGLGNGLGKLLEFLLPAKWRTRPPANPDVNDAVLARLTDQDPLYRALMDHAMAQFEADLMALMHGAQTNVEFFRGRASAMAQFISGMEHFRESARQQIQARNPKSEIRK